MTTSQLILIAGPYRSGTGGDPAKIAANLRALEPASLPIFRAGHVPMIGEWVALPVLREIEEVAVSGAGAAGGEGVAGAGTPPSPGFDGDVMYETAARLLEHCDGVLRLPGESAGADNDVAIARRRGIPVYARVEDLPGYVG